ncbi:MAG TPA: TetR family transcriptional regulator, partial [Polyangiaceae bacterium]|nr:TetR family transcriptional regulator [Polyangiaceae bacterium]
TTGSRSSGASETRERLLNAIKALAQRVPVNEITAADIAREADVSWPTARRHLGDATQVRRWVLEVHPQAQESESTEQRLLKAAASVFATSGYAGATLEQVGQAAGLTKGAVYWCFKSKEELFLRVMKERDERLQLWGNALLSAELEANVASREFMPLLKRVLEKHFRALAADETHLRLQIEFLAASRDATARRALAAAYRRQRQLIEGIVRALCTRGILREDAPVETIAQLLLLLFDGFVTMLLASPALAKDASWAAELARMLALGLEQYAPKPRA